MPTSSTRSVWVWGLTLSLLGCAGSRTAGPAPAGPGNPSAPPAGPGGPQTLGPGGLKPLLAREIAPLPKHTVALPEGRASGEVESAADPLVKRVEKATAIVLPIGSQTPISCVVYDEQIDPGATLLRMTQAMQAAAKDVTFDAVTPTEAGAIGETPYVLLSIAYSKLTPRGKVVGQVKMLARPDKDLSIVCYHDEVGYHASFKRIAVGLIQSLRAKTPTPPADFVEIQVAKVGDMPVGFDHRTIRALPDGTKLDQTISCMLLPRSRTDLMVTDRASIDHVDAAGLLQLSHTVETQGGELELEVEVTRQKAGHGYSYTGKKSGKEISGRFKAKNRQGLFSPILVAKQLRDRLLSGKAAELTIEEYHPGVSLEPLDVVYRRPPSGGTPAPGDVVLRLGQMEASGHLDERGLIDRMSMPIAGFTMSQARVFARGTP